MRPSVTSSFTYDCESWTLTAELQRKMQAREMRLYRNILCISYEGHVSEEVRAKIRQAVGPHETLLTVVKRCKLQWYGHVFRSSGLAKTILQGRVKGGRRQGRQKKRWEDNIRIMDRPGVRQVPEGSGEQRKIEETVCEIICVAPRPSRLWDTR